MKQRKTSKQRLMTAYVLLSVISLLGLMLYLMLGEAVGSGNEEQRITEQERADQPAADSEQEPKPQDTFPQTKVKKNREPAEEREAEKADLRYLYVIIDDAGNNLRHLEPFLNFPGKLAVAVLPQLPFSELSARQIQEAGKEVLLHFPMEAENGSNPGPGAIYADYDEETIRRVIAANLETVPGAIGVNNHQGSRITTNRAIMETILEDIDKRSLFFIDSRTTRNTVAAEVAEELGMPFAERNVFLDNKTEREYIRQQIDEGLELAGKTGHAVMIGHVQNAVLADVLMDSYQSLTEQGYVFESLKRLTSEESENDSTRH